MDEQLSLVEHICTTTLSQAPQLQKLLRALFAHHHAPVNADALARSIYSKRHCDQNPHSVREDVRTLCTALRAALTKYLASDVATNHPITCSIPSAKKTHGYQLQFHRRSLVPSTTTTTTPTLDDLENLARQTSATFWPQLSHHFLMLCKLKSCYMRVVKPAGRLSAFITLPTTYSHFLTLLNCPTVYIQALTPRCGRIYPLTVWLHHLLTIESHRPLNLKKEWRSDIGTDAADALSALTIYLLRSRSSKLVIHPEPVHELEYGLDVNSALLDILDLGSTVSLCWNPLGYIDVEPCILSKALAETF